MDTRYETKLEQARQDLIAADQKVARGIALLLKVNNKIPEKEYDVQNIVTYLITADEIKQLNLNQFFPNEGRNGLVVHSYREGYIPHPPLRYMLQQKVDSLVQAAIINKYKHSLEAPIKKDIDSEIEKVTKHMWETVLKVDEKLEQLKEPLEKMTSQDEKVNFFHEQSERLVHEITSDTLLNLYDIIRPNTDYKIFSTAVINESMHHRSNLTDILVLDAAKKTFSYDALYSPVTAHDRGLLANTANLSIVFEGNYTEDGRCTVTSTVTKHASLAPIDAISEERIDDLYEEECGYLNFYLQPYRRSSAYNG